MNGRLDPLVWRIASVVFWGPLLTSLDSTVVNVSLSTLTRELHAPLAIIHWVTSGYLLALALMLPLSGWLVDAIGAKRVYLGCFAAFTFASALCGTAASAAWLIAFRVLQGGVGGLLAPMAQMMAARSAGPYVARVMSMIAIPVLVGPILGPTVAGLILQHAGWRWIFYLNGPIGCIAIFLAWRILPSDIDLRQPRPFDFIGFCLLPPALVLLLLALDRLGTGGQTSFSTYGILGLAVMLLAGFVHHSRVRGAAALIDLSLFRSRTFRASARTQFMTNAVSFGGQMLVPLYILLAAHASPVTTGYLMAPMGLGLLCSLPQVGKLTERFGPRSVSSIGAALALLATIPLALGFHAVLPIPVFCALLFVRGIGLGGINIPSIAAAYADVSRERLPVATTAINIAQRLGGPIATTVLALFLHDRLSSTSLSALEAFHEAFALLCVLHALSLAAALYLPLRNGASGIAQHAA